MAAREEAVEANTQDVYTILMFVICAPVSVRMDRIYPGGQEEKEGELSDLWGSFTFDGVCGGRILRLLFIYYTSSSS